MPLIGRRWKRKRILWVDGIREGFDPRIIELASIVVVDGGRKMKGKERVQGIHHLRVSCQSVYVSWL